MTGLFRWNAQLFLAVGIREQWEKVQVAVPAKLSSCSVAPMICVGGRALWYQSFFNVSLVETGPMKTMFGSLIRNIGLVFLGSVLIATAALAEEAPGMRVGVRGEITGVSEEVLKVHANTGENVVIQLTKDTQVRAVTPANIEDIKPGSYIGSAAIPQDDGTLKALEVHVFPPEMAGTGDGHHPFDLVKGSSMTNGIVADLVVSNGRVLTVNYKGGRQTILVPEDVPIVNLTPADRSLLKVGVKVVLFATQSADGTLTAQSISAGKDGVAPPM